MKKLFGRGLLVLALLATALSFGASTEVSAGEEECSFDKASTPNTWILQEDCEVTSTVFIPDGITLDGNANTITAVDPEGDFFRGAVVQNEANATEIHIRELKIESDGLGDSCTESYSPNGLYGIGLFGASGSVVDSSINGIHRKVSSAYGCQNGRAIYVGNPSSSEVKYEVTITGNTITDYQKAGIDVRGNTQVTISGNEIGTSVGQSVIGANSVELVNGPSGSVTDNKISGNQWLDDRPVEDSASTILIFNSSNVEIRNNTITGNSDIAINIYGDENSRGNTVVNNTISDDSNIADGPHGDAGIWDGGIDTTVYGNTATGFDVPIVNTYTGVCYTAWTGALRVDSDCAPWEKPLHLADGAVDTIYTDTFDMCVRNGNGLVRYEPEGNCDSLWGWWVGEDKVPYPNPGLISICVNDDTGRVRVVDVGTSCQLDEWAGQI